MPIPSQDPSRAPSIGETFVMRTPSPSRPPPVKRALHPLPKSSAPPGPGGAPSEPAPCPSLPSRMPRWLKSAVLRSFVLRATSPSGSSSSSCSSRAPSGTDSSPVAAANTPKNKDIMGRVGNLGLLLPIGIPTTLAAVAYAGHWALHFDWKSWLNEFVSGPGRNSRILLVIFLVLNWKSLPLGWTFRILSSFTYHYFRPRPPLPPRALFHYAITTSYTTPLETDYNLHKSNSTYFSDVDVSRSHLVTHLLGAAVPRLPHIVRDKAGNPVPGSVGIGLGAVFCSFRKELAPLRKFEMWSRVLSWDRKWMYIVTHFVPAGVVKPTAWDGRSGGPTRVVRSKDGKEVAEEEMSKYVCATAVSKYVFKLGRFTVHPAYVFEAGGMLPERPEEGWRGGEDETGGMEGLGEVDETGEWGWKQVEQERRRGLVLAKHFHALDETNALFDGGKDGAMGRFPLG